MTEPYTDIKQYDADQRQAAQRIEGTGELLIRRSHLPCATNDLSTVFLARTEGSRVIMRNLVTDVDHSVNASTIGSMFSTDYLAEIDDEEIANPFTPTGVRIICDTDDTRRLLQSKVMRSQTLPPGTKRQFTMLNSFRCPSVLMSLPAMLREKFWIPEAYDAEDSYVWADYVGLDETIESLLELATLCLDMPEGPLGTLITRRQSTEQYVLSAAWFNSTAAMYRQLTTLTDIDNAIAGLDPDFGQRLAITGQSMRLIPDGTDTVVVNSPFKSKTDRNLYIWSHDVELGLNSFAEATIADITIDADRRTRFVLTPGRRHRASLTKMLNSEAVLVAVEKPIFRRQRKATRWARPTEVAANTGSAAEIPQAVAAAAGRIPAEPRQERIRAREEV